jgi:hypothetical protein
LNYHAQRVSDQQDFYAAAIQDMGKGKIIRRQTSEFFSRLLHFTQARQVYGFHSDRCPEKD